MTLSAYQLNLLAGVSWTITLALIILFIVGAVVVFGAAREKRG